jgi:hypothetical protein
MWGNEEEIEIRLNNGQQQSNSFVIQKGENEIRILSGGEDDNLFYQHGFGKGQRPKICFGVKNGCPYHGSEFQKPQTKVMFYVLNRKTNAASIQTADLTWSVRQKLLILSGQKNYRFTSMPMPYDVTIIYNPKAQPADMYEVIPVPEKVEVSASILKELELKEPLKDVIRQRILKAKEEYEREAAGPITQTVKIEEDKKSNIDDSDLDGDIKLEDIPF